MMAESNHELMIESIDAHQHFWVFDPVRDNWIDEPMNAIQKDFLPEELALILKANGIDGCITIQSNQLESENDFQLKNAEQNAFIKGVVGWVDLQANNVEERMAWYAGLKKIKGFRHVLQGEPQRDLMLMPAFMNGISLLNKYDFTYDLLILPDQLKFAVKLAKKFPDQKFVVDHLAKPPIKLNLIKAWKKDIAAFSMLENVSCKISGMVTEADWQNWKPSDFTPYIDVVAEVFGMDRIMFGSDWPVCNVAGGYTKTLGIVKEYFSTFTQNEQDKFFGFNAKAFYRLD